MLRLDRCDGPPCSRCGCQDVRIIQTPTGNGSWWDSGRARCRHCGLVFSFREMPEPKPLDILAEMPLLAPETHGTETPIEQAAVVCEKCGGPMQITSTRKTIRYHKCQRCGWKTKTVRS